MIDLYEIILKGTRSSVTIMNASYGKPLLPAHEIGVCFFCPDRNNGKYIRFG